MKTNKSPLRWGAALLLGGALPLIAIACGSSASSGDDACGAGTGPTNGGSASHGGTESGVAGGAAGEATIAGDGGARTTGAGGDSTDAGMSSGGASSPAECSHASDCTLPKTKPAGCAEAKCEAQKCVFLALDADGDGERTTTCKATSAGVEIETGKDCDDGDADVNTGQTERCDGKDDDCNGEIDDGIPASKIACTNGLGACKGDGFLECNEGTFSKCNAEPAAEPSADTKECAGIDTNCNGTVDLDGCVCKSNVDKLTCKQPCGADYEVTCKPDGTWPDCDPGPAPADYCQDLDADGYPGVCASYCAGGVPEGWQAATVFTGKSADCDDSSKLRFPGNTEVCDGLDNDCSATTGEPAKSCGACGSVACGVACKAQCPGGFVPQADGTCLEAVPSSQPIRQDDKVCANFPCFGLKEDYDVSQSCGDGYVRATLDVQATSGAGNCSAYFLSDDPHDCSIRVHRQTNGCNCFTCSMTVATRRQVAQCQ